MLDSAPEWPGGKPFAFTIVDDTDASTVENTKPVYDLLSDLGIHTTKTVWPLHPSDKPGYAYGSLEDAAYRDWVLALRDQGFEIAIHGTTDGSSPRERILAGLERFRETLGGDPRMHVNHVGQRDNIYWYEDRLVGPPRWIYQAWRVLKRRPAASLGHHSGTPYFWGDLVRDHIEYVRNFTFTEINTLKLDPWMPYHSPAHPYVKYWYSASQGTDCRRLNALLSESAQDRLAAEGGCCIAYTHFGFGFAENGRLNDDFRRLMTRLAGLGGYFAPVSTILDHLRARPGWREKIGSLDLQRLQWRWLQEKRRHGTL